MHLMHEKQVNGRYEPQATIACPIDHALHAALHSSGSAATY